jgi:cell wall-associated NlpC family hydrolase
MKNLTIVSVLLTVFTVTSHTALAQPSNGNNFLPVKNTISIKSGKKVTAKNEEPVSLEDCSALQFKYAQLTDMEVEHIADSYLFNFIEEWWAVKYRYGGTTKRGVDCSSYTGQLFQSVYGISLPRTARLQYGATARVNRNDLQEGDLVFFNTIGGVSHVGVYVGNDRFTHSSCSHGVTVSSLNDPYYSRKFISGGRITKVEEEPPVIEDAPSTISTENIESTDF